MTLADVAWEATGRHRFRAALVTAFAALSLLLAMVGLFGVLAYSVQQRLRDFGIRRALGGSTSDVLRPVVGSALRVTAVGAIAGLALAAALTRWLSTLLFGIEPLDPMTFAAVVFLLALTAVAATAGPALRALRVDPATALRGD
jgi:putative ABC transport system permease protein